MNPEQHKAPSNDEEREMAAHREGVRRSVLRANRAVAIILAVVVVLGVAMVLVSHRAHQSQRRAERAELNATERLWNSYVAQARAERLSTEAGHRRAALTAISNGAAIRPSIELRDEAMSSLVMRDLVPETSWPLTPRAYGFHFDPEVRHYVVSYESDALSLFRLADNELLRTFRAAEAGLPSNAVVREFLFSGTGRYVAVYYSTGASVLWERDSGRPALVSGLDPGQERFAWTPSFSADDRLMAAPCATHRGRVLLIELPSGATREVSGPEPFNDTIRLSPKGDVLSWFRDKEIFLTEPATGALRRTLGSLAEVMTLWWDQQGDQFSVSCRDASMQVWDVQAGTSRQLEGRAVNAWRQQFSPDGTKLAAAGVDGTSRLWDVPTGRLLSRTTAGRAFVFALDGERIAYGVPGREIGVWRISPPVGHRLIQGVVRENTPVSQQDLSPDGRWLVWAPQARAQRPGFELFDLESNRPPLFVPARSAVSVGFHPAKPWLAVAGADGLLLHDLPSDPNADSTGGVVAGSALGPSRPVALPGGFEPRAFSFDGTGNKAVVMSADRRLVVIDLQVPGRFIPLEGQLAGRLELPGPASMTGSGALAMSPDGHWVVAGRETRDGRPVIWDATTGAIALRLPTGSAHVVFSPDGRWLATVGTAECNVWTTGTWDHRWKRPRPALLGGFGAAAFTRDGSLMAFTRTYDAIEVVDPATGERLTDVDAADALTVAGLRLSADGRRLAVPGNDGQTQLWDLRTLRTELVRWRLDWPMPVSASRALLAPADSVVTGPARFAALGLVGVGIAGLLGMIVLRRQRRLTDEYLQTADLAAQRTRELAAEREVSELKSRFVSLVSHELRTPLGITMSAVELLRNYMNRLPPERLRELLNDIYSATLRMAGLMEQALVLGRVEAGRVTVQARPLDLPAFGAKLVEEIRVATHQKCPIELRTTGELGGAAGDEALLRHLLSNLLSNAVKYSPAATRVEFDLRREERTAVMVIRDRGIGIPEADQARLFEAFHRASNVGETPGTGLGLLIVRRCVELHRGKITFTSTPGEGTAFVVRLPLFGQESVV